MSMEVMTYLVRGVKIAEIVSDQIIIEGSEDILDLIGNLYYQDFDKIIIYEQNITPAFFDLKTGIAGEILQKFSNYRMSLAIVGDFAAYQNKNLKDFIYESNKRGQISFVATISEALK